MSERLKEFLEKINQEGVKQAEEKAKVIETRANTEVEKILKDAKKEAEEIVKSAKDEAKRMEENTQIVLKQAARDLILSLKDEIRKIFNKVVSIETSKAVSPKEISDILANLIEKFIDKKGESSDIKVLLKKEDLEKLKGTFISKLKERLKDGIEFRPSTNINAGFSISFDKGKSFFDFTDEALQEALSAYLNPELARLLK